jgi:hypothetical protein
MSRVLLILAFEVATACAALAQSPVRFSASIDSFGGHSYTVELRDGKLVYSDKTAQSTTGPIAISPSAEQWHQFRRALDAINVWAWHKSYEPGEMISDGTTWSLWLAYPDRSVFSDGGNCYPDARGNPNGVPRRTPAFRQLEAAIEALLGGKTFRSDDDEAKQ